MTHTAVKLVTALMEDKLPSHAQTLKDFGFEGAGSEMYMLLGVYIGLVKHLGVTANTLHKWQSTGTLLENIKLEYNKRPDGRRGEYYPWLLNNQHLLTHE